MYYALTRILILITDGSNGQNIILCVHVCIFGELTGKRVHQSASFRELTSVRFGIPWRFGCLAVRPGTVGPRVRRQEMCSRRTSQH